MLAIKPQILHLVVLWKGGYDFLEDDYNAVERKGYIADKIYYQIKRRWIEIVRRSSISQKSHSPASTPGLKKLFDKASSGQTATCQRLIPEKRRFIFVLLYCMSFSLIKIKQDLLALCKEIKATWVTLQSSIRTPILTRDVDLVQLEKHMPSFSMTMSFPSMIDGNS